MTYYPVIIPTLNRFQHFKECVESLAACTHADKTELVIGLDYPPSEKYVEGWEQIKTYIPTITGFAKVTVFEHDHNLGPSGNSHALKQYVADKYDAWIYTEDDNVFSPCFLDYMDKCLDKYKDDENILAVSGYMDPVNFSFAGNTSVVRMQDYMAWGVGNWKKKREELNREMPEHYMRYVCSHRKLLWKMRHNLRDLYQLIFWIKNNPKLDIRCDFTIACYCIINGRYVINPMLSLVRNMGYDGSGEHCGTLNDDFYSKQNISKDEYFEIFDNLTEIENKKIVEQWELYKHRDFSREQRKLVLRYYYTYMIFGYKFGNFLLNFKSNLRMILKQSRFISSLYYALTLKK